MIPLKRICVMSVRRTHSWRSSFSRIVVCGSASADSNDRIIRYARRPFVCICIAVIAPALGRKQSVRGVSPNGFHVFSIRLVNLNLQGSNLRERRRSTHRKIDANFSSLVSLSRVNSVIDYSFAGPGLSGDWANQQQINRLSSTTESTNDIFFICSSISY